MHIYIFDYSIIYNFFNVNTSGKIVTFSLIFPIFFSIFCYTPLAKLKLLSYNVLNDAGVAQSVEHLTRNEKVTCSSHATSSTVKDAFLRPLFFALFPRYIPFILFPY